MHFNSILLSILRGTQDCPANLCPIFHILEFGTTDKGHLLWPTATLAASNVRKLSPFKNKEQFQISRL